MSAPQHLFDGLDLSRFKELCRSIEKGSKTKLKYTDLDLWIARSWKEAVRLRLDHQPSLDILDIGIGPGYFLYVCQKLGHRCVGLDRPGMFPFWEEVRQWLGIDHIVEHTISPNTPLPDLGRFDLVTAYRCPFNYFRQEDRLWELAEWAFFLDHLRDDVLRPNGRFALKLTEQYDKGEGPQRGEASLAQLVKERGAVQAGAVLIFDPLL